MKLLAAMTELFVQAFQVTRPQPDQQHRVQILIGGLTLLVLLIVATLIAGMLIWASQA